ncbi:MAG: AAA family ATPase [Gammaproteobacteria bacterium]
MYYDYFGFRQPPFKITPDTSLFYPGGERGAVLDALLYAILNGEGIVKVVGEVGSGKTMLCRMLEQELPDRVEVVYLANPSLAPENTVHAIAFELNLEIPAGASRFEVMNRLQEYLLQRHSQDRQVVVFVEEAQSMPLATLEEIRLLSNLETKQNKLLQIVLFGQPELDEMIATPEIRQLKERITYSFRLNPFQSDDIRDYLNSRVRACGYRADTLFDRSAVRDIERYSKGLLRRINILADKALLAAYAEHTHRVSSKHIRKAAADSEFSTGSGMRRGGLRRLLFATTGLIILALLVVWLAGPVRLSVPEPALSDTAVPAPGEETGTAASAGEDPPPASLRDKETAAPATEKDEPAEEAGEVLRAAEEAPDETAADRHIPAEIVTGKDADVLTGVKVSEPERKEDAQVSESRVVTEPEPGRPVRTYTVLELGGLDGAAFSETEANALIRQLETVPPETVVLSGQDLGDEACDRCRSIVYRPLKTVENL